MRTMPKPNGPPEKVLVPLKGLVPDAHEEDVCVVAVAVVVETDTQMDVHLSLCSRLIWHQLHAFDGWVHYQIKTGLGPSP